MRTTILHARTAIAVLLVLLMGISAKAALNGTYTINVGALASATNYTSVSAAVSDLMTGVRSDGGPVNGPGVSGPVTLRIAAGSGPIPSRSHLDPLQVPPPILYA